MLFLFLMVAAPFAIPFIAPVVALFIMNKAGEPK